MPSIKDLIPIRTSGKQLKHDLGLDKFDKILISKIIDFPVDIYIVYFNSRFPTVHIAMSKVKKLDTFVINRIKRSGFSFDFKKFKLTPPLDLSSFTARIPSNSIIIRVDITGEFFANKSLYKESTDKFKKKNILVV